MSGFISAARNAIAQWLIAAVIGFAGGVSIGGVGAQAEAERPNPPDFVRAWRAFMQGDADYRTCVREAQRVAIARMWTQRVPLESAMTDVSVAYRGCPGFDSFWSTLYFAGYDAPEAYIAAELALAKAAARALLERFDAEEEDDRVRALAMEDAVTFFTKAIDQVRTDEGQLPRATLDAIEDRLLGMRYVVEALGRGRWNPMETPSLAELVAEHAERLTRILPETAVAELTDALDVAMERRYARDPVRELAQDMRR